LPDSEYVEEAAPNWEGERHALLSQRISDIGLEIRGTLLEKLVGQLYEELAVKGLEFRPPVYLSDQWGCPDGTPLIGVPFYLADARLSKIEEDYSAAVEGADEAMRYLRHEAGHAFNYAYRLYDRPDWRKMFGPYSRPYRERYRADPFSRDFVRHMRTRPFELVRFHSDHMTLHPGDLFSTGCPKGARIKAGDRVRARIEGVGALSANVTENRMSDVGFRISGDL